MTDRKTKKRVKHDIELELTVDGDDQAQILNILAEVREALGDIKISKIEIDRREYLEYVN